MFLDQQHETFYLYLILYARIIVAKISVMPLAIMMGTLILNSPYKNQSKVPNVKRAYMESDIPEVSFV
jgi:hypothetical protein